MSDRAALIDRFLARHGLQDWTRSILAGDASARRYLRLSGQGKSVILMDAPPHNGEDTVPFVQMAHLLIQNDLRAPEILGHDAKAGLVLLSDLGQSDFSGWLNKHAQDAQDLYRAATDVLLHLETVAPPTHLKRMTPAVGAKMIEILGAHYTDASMTGLCAELDAALTKFAPDPSVLALRDYHAENLIWRPELEGRDRVGLLDFQDAFIAPAGYDLASLLRDARRDVPADLADNIIDYFAEHSQNGIGIRLAMATLGVQRNLRILGVFARLAATMNKRRYLDFMPRVWAHIQQDLNHPDLVRLKQAVLDTIPAPKPDHIESIAP